MVQEYNEHSIKTGRIQILHVVWLIQSYNPTFWIRFRDEPIEWNWAIRKRKPKEGAKQLTLNLDNKFYYIH